MSAPQDMDHEENSVDDDSFDEELDDATEIASDDFAEWGGNELEQAYMKAMMALEASDAAMPDETNSQVEVSIGEEANVDSEPSVSTDLGQSAAPESGSEVVSNSNEQADSLSELFPSPVLTNSSNAVATQSPSAEARPIPRQILEACLFVGGSALTSKKLSGVLRGDFDVEFVDREIDELNRLYAAEGRPYEIRLGEGGYRLTLRQEYERIRYKVYGLGPKEVRLSQEALEVLAVVAYHQPINQPRLEELGKPGCGAVLRQLVRRELLAVERDPARPRDVNYITTPRFLSLFGIRNLDELPRHEQVSYK